MSTLNVLIIAAGTWKFFKLCNVFNRTGHCNVPLIIALSIKKKI